MFYTVPKSSERVRELRAKYTKHLTTITQNRMPINDAYDEQPYHGREKLLGKRLNKDENLKMQYTNEIHKPLENGYAYVPQEDLTRADGKVWYLPHHPVFNRRKPEKCRVVFVCAAKYRGLSLNDHIHQGSDLASWLESF